MRRQDGGQGVKDMKVKSPEEVYFFSMPIKESEIIDVFLGHHSRRGFEGYTVAKADAP